LASPGPSAALSWWRSTLPISRKRKQPHSGDTGAALNIYPAADGVQHCEVAGMRDTLDARGQNTELGLAANATSPRKNWKTKIRDMNHEAPSIPP
jgi:hypothetical protein